jgi:hypothetical protein
MMSSTKIISLSSPDLPKGKKNQGSTTTPPPGPSPQDKTLLQ